MSLFPKKKVEYPFKYSKRHWFSCISKPNASVEFVQMRFEYCL